MRSSALFVFLRPLALVLTAQKAQQLLTRILLLSNAVLNVGTIETADEMSRVHQP